MAEESSHSQDLNNAFIIERTPTKGTKRNRRRVLRNKSSLILFNSFILFVPEKCCGLYWNEGCSLDLGSKNSGYIGMRVLLECGFN